MSVRTFITSFLDGFTGAGIFEDLHRPGRLIGSSRRSLSRCSRLRRVANSTKKSNCKAPTRSLKIIEACSSVAQ
jgi:hypothetical protein